LKVEIRELTDQQALLAMDAENRLRSDLSPYERAVAYAGWLRGGQFNSQQELAKALGISPSQVSRLLQLARLPAVVVNAFSSPLEIREGWGGELMDKMEGGKRDAVIRVARAIARSSRRPNAAAAYRQLMAAGAESNRRKLRERVEVVKDSDGHPLFRVKYHRSSISLVLPVDKMPESVIQDLCSILSARLQHFRIAEPRTSGDEVPRRAMSLKVVAVRDQEHDL
jgi:ParB family chromosome partitioning protein